MASDGRILFPATREGTTTSYFPTPFERELFMFFINDKMLRVNRTLELQFAVEFQLFHANSRAEWALVIELGTAPADTSPSTPSPDNLQNIAWTAAPALSQRIILTPLKSKHPFGLRVVRKAGGITCDKMSYGVWEGNNANAPAGANFAVRARLIHFDTENAVAAPRGWVSYDITDPDGAPAAAIIS